MTHWLLLAGAGLLAGAMNAVAGGGSFVSLPALIAAGVPSVNANASSTVALIPGAITSGFAYRRNFRAFSNISIPALVVVSLVGGLLGAVRLLVTPQAVFDGALPWLLLIGSTTFAFGRQAGRWLRERISIGPMLSLSVQFLLGIYGGYFGGAVGIMMMAAWSLLGATDLHAMNATRTMIVGATNAVAAVIFIVGGLIVWPQTLVMLIAASVGGYAGAAVTRGLDPEKARIAISALNFTMTALFFWRAYS